MITDRRRLATRFAEILRGLPARFDLPILLVVHIHEPFAVALAEWLDGRIAKAVGATGSTRRAIATVAAR
ncbi:MAG: hypothetical protein E6J90_01085 [Deltaproteobacteria bacterium]|nr:MAG: hypothetical protein E6J91_01725 [Deltaproteobacteria bacterium]TMQ28058.1 MAG: hypothetical protein E6J90_01085 [Deltaproteobacteria bacterium]